MGKRDRSERRRHSSAFSSLKTKQSGEFRHRTKHSNRFSRSSRRDFSDLPQDLVTKIGESLNCSTLKTASVVCKSWCDTLRPLLEHNKDCMNLGKKLKHDGDLDKALEKFLEAVEYGSTSAMVEAGLIYWKRKQKDEAFGMFRRAAVLGNRNARSNLGLVYLQEEPPNTKKAQKWFYLASLQGHVRAQYQLAVCLVHGHDMRGAAWWYLKAAEGGYGRAMHYVSTFYKNGVGLVQSDTEARKWMERAALCGYSKALAQDDR